MYVQGYLAHKKNFIPQGTPRDPLEVPLYRGTSLENRHPVGPYSRTMPKLLWRSWGGGRFLMSEVPLYSSSLFVGAKHALPKPHRVLKHNFPKARSSKALSGRLEFTVGRLKFNQDSLSSKTRVAEGSYVCAQTHLLSAPSTLSQRRAQFCTGVRSENTGKGGFTYMHVLVLTFCLYP